MSLNTQVYFSFWTIRLDAYETGIRVLNLPASFFQNHTDTSDAQNAIKVIKTDMSY